MDAKSGRDQKKKRRARLVKTHLYHSATLHTPPYLCRMGNILKMQNHYRKTALNVATREDKIILEAQPLRRRLSMTDALAIGFDGKHQRDPTKSRLLPEEPELMQMVLDYLKM